MSGSDGDHGTSKPTSGLNQEKFTLILDLLYIQLLKLYMYRPPAEYAVGQEIIYCTDICLP